MEVKKDKSFIEYLASLPLGTKVSIAVAMIAVLLAVGVGGDGGGNNSKDNRNRYSVEELGELCSEIEGVGECRVMIHYEADGAVYSVAVVCEGAESDSVREKIVELISSLYGIGAHRISVLKISK